MKTVIMFPTVEAANHMAERIQQRELEAQQVHSSCSALFSHHVLNIVASSSCHPRVLAGRPAAGEHGESKGGLDRVSEGAAEVKGGGGRGAQQGCGRTQRSV